MAKYFLDQEFHEYFKKPISWLPTIGNFNKPYHTIELISIGIACEDGREYYAVSNEFDIKAAYFKFQKSECCKMPGFCPAVMQGECTGYKKEYWLRENVLSPIFYSFYKPNLINIHSIYNMLFPNMKTVIKEVGKSKNKIAEEVRNFVCNPTGHPDPGYVAHLYKGEKPEFFGYYADYDWVLFCSLFGTMMDLPKGFPMYCIDLKQMVDEFAEKVTAEARVNDSHTPAVTHETIKNNNPFYPKQIDEHHALADAKWNYQLYKFLKSNLKGV